MIRLGHGGCAHWLICLFSQQIFTVCLPCTRHCWKFLRHLSKHNRRRPLTTQKHSCSPSCLDACAWSQGRVAESWSKQSEVQSLNPNRYCILEEGAGVESQGIQEQRRDNKWGVQEYLRKARSGGFPEPKEKVTARALWTIQGPERRGDLGKREQ